MSISFNKKMFVQNLMCYDYKKFIEQFKDSIGFDNIEQMQPKFDFYDLKSNFLFIKLNNKYFGINCIDITKPSILRKEPSTKFYLNTNIKNNSIENIDSLSNFDLYHYSTKDSKYYSKYYIDKDKLNKFVKKFKFFEGFDNIEEILPILEKLKLIKSRCLFIKFRNQYYPVFYGSLNSQIVIGKEIIFYSNNGIFKQKNLNEVKLNIEVKSRTFKPTITQTLNYELQLLDNNIEIYYYKNLNSKQYTKYSDDINNCGNCITLLGISFSNIFIDVDKLSSIDNYFQTLKPFGKLLKKSRKSNIIIDKINPFRQEVLLNTGEILNYRITVTPMNFGQPVIEYKLIK